MKPSVPSKTLCEYSPRNVRFHGGAVEALPETLQVRGPKGSPALIQALAGVSALMPSSGRPSPFASLHGMPELVKLLFAQENWAARFRCSFTRKLASRSTPSTFGSRLYVKTPVVTLQILGLAIWAAVSHCPLR